MRRGEAWRAVPGNRRNSDAAQEFYDHESVVAWRRSRRSEHFSRVDVRNVHGRQPTQSLPRLHWPAAKRGELGNGNGGLQALADYFLSVCFDALLRFELTLRKFADPEGHHLTTDLEFARQF
jgi:hypothetical protein